MDVNTQYKVAAVQASPVFLDANATIDKTITLMEEAAKNGAKIIAFPETWVPGYPWFIWLDAPAWGLQFIPEYAQNSIRADGPEMERVKQAAKANNIYVSLGYSEKHGGSQYIAQILISDAGEVVRARRKLKPTHVERTIFGEGDGSDLVVDETPLGRLGALCCWEHLQPLSKYAMYSMNEEVHFGAWPSFSVYPGAAYALGPEVNTSASQIYAAEGQCFVISPCATVSDEMIERLCDAPHKHDFLKAGGGYARIFGPDGRPLAEPLDPAAEGIIYADIDLTMISIAKAAADPAGHYSRPDVTRLWLNREPAPRVMEMSKGAGGTNDAVQEAGVEAASPSEQSGACPASVKKKRMPDGWVPSYPSYTARLDDSVTDPVFAYIGGQSETDSDLKAFTEWMEEVLASGRSAPDVVNRARFTDEAGVANHVYLLCWRAPADYESWAKQKAVSGWWKSKDRLTGALGVWREVVHVQKDRFETIFSSENPVGLAEAASGFDLVREHGYWGSARDRMPISEHDELEGVADTVLAKSANVSSKGKRVCVTAPQNMCVIRSGQYWGTCGEKELEYYQSKVHPTLLKGMDYLAKNGPEANCYTSRMMDQLDEKGQQHDRTFGLAFFKTMGDMEAWAEHHPTHLKIFHAFLKMAEVFEGNLDLQLWHEVYTVASESSEFEYVNCHSQTGLLAHIAQS